MAENFAINITAVDKATSTIRRITGELGRTTKPISDLHKAFGELGKSVGLGHVGAGLKHIERGAKDATEGLRSMIPPIAAITGVGTIAGIAALVSGFAKMVVHTQNSASVIGISANSLYRWQGAARLAGSSAEAMRASLEGIGDAFNAAQTTDPSRMGLLRQLNIDKVPMKDGSVDTEAGLLDVSDAFSKSNNAEWKRAVAGQLGISRDLIPMLSRGRKAMQEYFEASKQLAPTPDQQAKAENFYGSMLKLDFATDQLKNSFGAALAPALTVVVNSMTKLVDKYGDAVATGIADYVKKFTDYLMSVDWTKVGKDVDSFVDSLGGLKTVAAIIAAITFAGPIGAVIRLTSLLVGLSTTAATAAGALVAGGLGGGAEAAGGAILLSTTGAAVGLGAGLLGYSPSLNAGEGDYLAQRRQIGSREDYIATQLTGAGYSNAQAAGIVGSLLQEDGTLDPHMVNPKSGAMGIGQWLSKDRVAEFEKFSGTDLGHSSFEQQVAFMLHELATTENKADASVRATMAPSDASRAFTVGYERPGVEEANLPQRAINAQQFYDSRYGTAPMTKPKKAQPETGLYADPVIEESATPVYAPGTGPKQADTGGISIIDTKTGAAQQINMHLHVTGLPPGASAKATSPNAGVTVTAKVGQSSLGHDTL